MTLINNTTILHMQKGKGVIKHISQDIFLVIVNRLTIAFSCSMIIIHGTEHNFSYFLCIVKVLNVYKVVMFARFCYSSLNQVVYISYQLQKHTAFLCTSTMYQGGSGRGMGVLKF